MVSEHFINEEYVIMHAGRGTPRPRAKLDILHPRAKLEWSKSHLFPDEWVDRIDPNMAILKEICLYANIIWLRF